MKTNHIMNMMRTYYRSGAYKMTQGKSFHRGTTYSFHREQLRGMNLQHSTCALLSFQYLSNPSRPRASPWKPYWARPISELQATQNGLSTTSSVPHIHTKWNCNWKQLLFFRHDSWTPPLGGFSRIWYAFNQWLQNWQSGKAAEHVSDYHFTFWLCGIKDALPEKNWEHFFVESAGCFDTLRHRLFFGTAAKAFLPFQAARLHFSGPKARLWLWGSVFLSCIMHRYMEVPGMPVTVQKGEPTNCLIKSNNYFFSRLLQGGGQDPKNGNHGNKRSKQIEVISYWNQSVGSFVCFISFREKVFPCTSQAMIW